MSTTIRPCRAANPATCRVHGSANPMNAVGNYKTAYKFLSESKKNLARAKDLGQYEELQDLVDHDQLAFDATIQGIADQNVKIRDARLGRINLPLAEKLEAQQKIQKGRAYRQEVLAKDPSYAESESIFREAIKDHGVVSVTSLENEKEYDHMMETLKNVEVGTPVAIKLKNGSFIYDQAGNGYINGKKPGRLTAWAFGGRNSGFVQKFKDEPSSNAVVSLRNSSISVWVRNVAEIHVLKDDAFKNGMGEFVNLQHAKTMAPVSEAGETSYGRVGITGENFYHEIEGIYNPERSGKSQSASLNESHRLGWRTPSLDGDVDTYVTPISPVKSIITY